MCFALSQPSTQTASSASAAAHGAELTTPWSPQDCKGILFVNLQRKAVGAADRWLVVASVAETEEAMLAPPRCLMTPSRTPLSNVTNRHSRWNEDGTRASDRHMGVRAAVPPWGEYEELSVQSDGSSHDSTPRTAWSLHGAGITI